MSETLDPAGHQFRDHRPNIGPTGVCAASPSGLPCGPDVLVDPLRGTGYCETGRDAKEAVEARVPKLLG